MPLIKGEHVQSLLFHSDVADTREEELSGDVEQETLFHTDVIPARRSVTPIQPVPSDPLNAADLTQVDLFEETEQVKITRIEGCQVINPPVKRDWEEKKHKKKEWICTFVAPPDLWNQERDEWIQASTENKKDIAAFNKLKLNNGDMCTVIGIQTGGRPEPMAIGEKKRYLTFMKVTAIIPGIRGTSLKANVVQPKASRH
jgi:hypothetical protein